MQSINQILVTIALVLGLQSQVLQSQDISPKDPAEHIISQFDHYPLVALGEIHGKKDMHQLYSTLVQSAEFRKEVKVIVLEYANSLYQDQLDRYLNGEQVSFNEVQKAWRNLLVSPMLLHGSDEFAHLVKEVREVNQSLAPSSRIRILAGGPPIDWSKITTTEAYEQFRNKHVRDLHYAQVVIDQVLKKGEKALLISGSIHLKRQSTLVQLINQDYPGSIYHILPLFNFGNRTNELMTRLGPMQKPVILTLEDNWLGKIDKPSVVISGNRLLKSLTDEDEQKDGDLLVRKGPDGKKKVIQMTNGNMILLASENGNADQKAGNQTLGSAPEQKNQNTEDSGNTQAPQTTLYLNLPEGRWRRTVEDEGRTLLDVADALLLIGEEGLEEDASIWQDDAYWDELNRRYMIVFGTALDPRIRQSKGKFMEDH